MTYIRVEEEGEEREREREREKENPISEKRIGGKKRQRRKFKDSGSGGG